MPRSCAINIDKVANCDVTIGVSAAKPRAFRTAAANPASGILTVGGISKSRYSSVFPRFVSVESATKLAGFSVKTGLFARNNFSSAVKSLSGDTSVI